MIKIGVSTSVRFWNPEYVIKIAHEMGVGVELFPFRWHNLSFFKKLFKKYPVEVLSVHGPFAISNKDYCGMFWDKSSNIIVKFLILLWMVILGNLKNNMAIKISKKYRCPLVLHPIPLLEKEGISNVLLENVPPYASPFSLEEQIAMGKNFSGMVFDTAHIAYHCKNEKDFMRYFRCIDPKEIHLSDSFFGNINVHLPLGRGELPIKEMLEMLKKKRKEVNIILELDPGMGMGSEIKDSIRFIKNSIS